MYGSAGGAPRRWAPAASGEGECDKGPDLLYHRHPFSTYDDPRNLSGVQGEQAMLCILAQTAARPPRRRAPPPMDYSGLLQTEHFVLVPLIPVAPAQQPLLPPLAHLQKELSDADLSGGYMPSRVGGRMAFDKPQDLGRQAPQHADDRKMPAETPERVRKLQTLCVCIYILYTNIYICVRVRVVAYAGCRGGPLLPLRRLCADDAARLCPSPLLCYPPLSA